MNIEIRHITIVGTGLLGKSLALAIRSKFDKNVSITGIDNEPSRLKQALEDGSITHKAEGLQDVIDQTDLLILSTPVTVIRETLEKIIALNVKKELMIFDIGSSKKGIIEDMNRLPEHICAIGGHPMTGPMTSGYYEPHEKMFLDKVFVLTPSLRSTEDGISWFKNFIETIGSTPVIVDALDHDRIMSTVSHLPNLISIPFLEMVKNKQNDLFWSLSAGGYKRCTAQVNENPDMWKNILYENKDFIAPALKDLKKEIEAMCNILEEGNRDQINQLFDQARAAFLSHLEKA